MGITTLRSFSRASLSSLKADYHSWARIPQILRARGGVYYIKFVRYYKGIRRLGGFTTLTPCVPRYADYHLHTQEGRFAAEMQKKKV